MDRTTDTARQARDERLRAALARLRRRPAAAPDLRPGSAYEALLDERIRDLEKALVEIRSRINALYFTVIGAILVDVLVRLAHGR